MINAYDIKMRFKWRFINYRVWLIFVIQSGEHLGNVAVVLKHNGKGFTRTTTTNADGKFSLKALPVGQYTIQFVKNGYQTIKQSQLTVTAGNKANYDINMSLAGVETISVVGQMIQRIDMASSTSSISFDAQELVTCFWYLDC